MTRAKGSDRDVRAFVPYSARLTGRPVIRQQPVVELFRQSGDDGESI